MTMALLKHIVVYNGICWSANIEELQNLKGGLKQKNVHTLHVIPKMYDLIFSAEHKYNILQNLCSKTILDTIDY